VTAGLVLTVAACGDDEPTAEPAVLTAPADEMADDEMTSDDDMASDDMTDDDMSDDDMANEDMSDEDMADDDMTDDDMTDEDMSDDMTDDDMTDDMSDDMAMDLPSWMTHEITDVDGVTFMLADLIGQPVLIETFATWCPSCRSQLADTQAAAAELGDDAVVLALSVETDLDATEVADYAAENGFDDIRFAVLDAELLASLADAFGTSIANPPATPKVVIDATGHAGELSTGPTSAEDLVAQLRGAA
jgi:thiol-disulfide isomerase/thioredoxin